jgi:hypothetical protein
MVAERDRRTLGTVLGALGIMGSTLVILLGLGVLP